jgi:hypothetical protein
VRRQLDRDAGQLPMNDENDDGATEFEIAKVGRCPLCQPGSAVSDNPGGGLSRVHGVCQRELPAKKPRCPVINLEHPRCAERGVWWINYCCYQHVNAGKRMSRRWSGDPDGLKRYVSAISWGFAKN